MTRIREEEDCIFLQYGVQHISIVKFGFAHFVSAIFCAAWDQSDKFMKLYVTLKGVQRIEKELVKTEYTTK